MNSRSSDRAVARPRDRATACTPGGWHPESGLPPDAHAAQTRRVTDTSTRPAPGTATRWERHSPLRTAAELSLGLSFTVATAFGGYTAATGHLAVVSQVAGVAFVVTLMCVVVTWFRAVEREDARGSRSAPATVAAAPAVAHPLSAIDAEYRR